MGERQQMKTEEIIETLQDYNDWRRAKGKWDVDTFNKGESFFDTTTAREIGLTIDAAIERLKELERERVEARQEAETVRALYNDATGVTGTFPWETENHHD